MLGLLFLALVILALLYFGWRGYFGKTVQSDEVQALQAAKSRLQNGVTDASSDPAKKV